LAERLLLALILRGGVGATVDETDDGAKLLVMYGPSADGRPRCGGNSTRGETTEGRPETCCRGEPCDGGGRLALLPLLLWLAVAASNNGCVSGTGLNDAGGSGGESGARDVDPSELCLWLAEKEEYRESVEAESLCGSGGRCVLGEVAWVNTADVDQLSVERRRCGLVISAPGGSPA
jgi:hypothetical protein